MKKFSFRLDSLLKIRRFQAEQTRIELSLLQAKVQKEEIELRKMYENIENSFHLALEYKLGGDLIQPKLDQIDAYIFGERHRIVLKSDEIRQIKQDVEKKEYEWLEARKEVKRLEILREKKRIEHKKEVNKKEQKEMDDLVNMRRRVVS